MIYTTLKTTIISNNIGSYYMQLSASSQLLQTSAILQWLPSGFYRGYFSALCDNTVIASVNWAKYSYLGGCIVTEIGCLWILLCFKFLTIRIPGWEYLNRPSIKCLKKHTDDWLSTYARVHISYSCYNTNYSAGNESGLNLVSIRCGIHVHTTQIQSSLPAG